MELPGKILPGENRARPPRPIRPKRKPRERAGGRRVFLFVDLFAFDLFRVDNACHLIVLTLYYNMLLKRGTDIFFPRRRTQARRKCFVDDYCQGTFSDIDIL